MQGKKKEVLTVTHQKRSLMNNKISKRDISEEIFGHLEVQFGRKFKYNISQLGNLRIYEMT